MVNRIRNKRMAMWYRLDDPLADRLRDEADKLGLSTSALMRLVISKLIAKTDSKGGDILSVIDS